MRQDDCALIPFVLNVEAFIFLCVQTYTFLSATADQQQLPEGVRWDVRRFEAVRAGGHQEGGVHTVSNMRKRKFHLLAGVPAGVAGVTF